MHELIDVHNVQALAVLIEDQGEHLLARWREQVRQLPSGAPLDVPTLNDHIPGVLEEIVHALRGLHDETIPEALVSGSPPVHGLKRLQDGFDIVEVVAEYNILRGCIYDLAEAHGVEVRPKAFHILNRVFDEAIGLAVQSYATGRALEIQRRREEHLAFVAHDLRTPLSAVGLVAHMLEQRLAGPQRAPDIERMLRTLHRNVDHLTALVERVLKESADMRTETGIRLERRRFELWPLVESLIHDLHPVAGTASTALINRVPEDLTVLADASLLRRIFQNLIANAIRHTPRGSVEIGARASGVGCVECWVQDNGAGIPPDRLRQLFDKRAGNGESGRERLGLAVVKTFVEAHCGTVGVESTEGQGSVFRFTLPKQDDDHESPRQAKT
jgi:two-component system, OmpR family, phosphate regulon sensor histidine kinase PhoR